MNITQLADYLRTVKGCISLGLFDVLPRDKNLQGLIDLGMSVAERTETLLGLEVADYVKGPEPDDADCKKDIWVFGKVFYCKEIYIKTRLVTNSDRNWLTVLSFHLAEHKLKYPLKEDGA